MKLLLWLYLLPMTCSPPSVVCPVKETLAYSRETTPGIPGRDAPIDVTYYIYLVLEKGAAPAVTGVWIEGRFHAATLQRVDSPVEVEHDVAVPTGEKDTLVGETSDDVYRVEPGDERTWSPGDGAERRATEDNQVVVFLKVGRATCHGTAKEIKVLRPAPGM